MKVISSDWRVIKEDKPVAGDTVFRVYRILDINKPNEIGNREYREGLFVEERNAEFFAQKLNSNK